MKHREGTVRSELETRLLGYLNRYPTFMGITLYVSYESKAGNGRWRVTYKKDDLKSRWGITIK